MSGELPPPTERQVLYALVSGGFVVVAAVLVAGAAIGGLVPVWWSLVGSISTLGVAVFAMTRWRSTRSVLLASVGLLVAWVAGTLVVLV